MVGGGGAIAADCHGGADDRRIAGAAAQVALQRGFNLRLRRLGHRHPQRIQRHHEPRRAKAALAAVMVHHRLLHRMQPPVGAGQMFDGHHVAPVNRRQEPDAGVDRRIAQPLRPQPSDQNRARPAIALRTAFLGAGHAPLQPQEIQQGPACAGIMRGHLAAIQQKADVRALGHGGLLRVVHAAAGRARSRQDRPTHCIEKQRLLAKTLNKTLIMIG